MIEKLIIIEYRDEVKLYENVICGDTVVISMTPGVGVELKKRNIEFVDSLEFFGAEGHRSTLSISSEVVEHVRPIFNKFGFDNDTFEKNWIFYFRLYLHYWLSILYIIDAAVKKYRPKYLVAFKMKSISNPGLRITEKDKILGRIVHMYGDTHGIKVHYVEFVDKNKEKQKIVRQMFRYTTIIVFKFLLLVYPLVGRNRVPIIAPDGSYNMSRLLNEVSEKIEGSLIVYMQQNNRSNLFNDLINMVRGKSFSFMLLPVREDYKKTYFSRELNVCTKHINDWLFNHKNNITVCGVNLAQPLSEFISYGLADGMCAINDRIISMYRVLDVVQPQYVFSQHSLGINYELGEYCAKHSIPSMLVSHGSHVPHPGTVAELEWSVFAHTMINSKFPFVALQTPCAAAFMRNQNNVVSSCIKTGALLFARKINSAENLIPAKKKLFKGCENKSIILHASSPRDWKGLRPWVYETTDEYIRNINDIIRTVERSPSLYLAIRFRPTSHLSLSDFKGSLIDSDCYDIYDDGSFEEYLLASDLLISYSSTTIEEALQNKIPVLQYDPDGKYMHIKAPLIDDNKFIDNPIYYCGNKRTLKKSITAVLENIELIKSNEAAWFMYNYPIDENLTWLGAINNNPDD